MTTVFALAAGVNEGYAAISVVQAEMFASATRTLVSVFAQVELDFNGQSPLPLSKMTYLANTKSNTKKSFQGDRKKLRL